MAQAQAGTIEAQRAQQAQQQEAACGERRHPASDAAGYGRFRIREPAIAGQGHAGKVRVQAGRADHRDRDRQQHRNRRPRHPPRFVGQHQPRQQEPKGGERLQHHPRQQATQQAQRRLPVQQHQQREAGNPQPDPSHEHPPPRAGLRQGQRWGLGRVVHAARMIPGARATPAAPYTRLDRGCGARTHDVGLDPAVGGACLRRPAVHRRLAGRTPAAAGAGTARARHRLCPGAGGVLLVVDLLRRGRNRRARRTGVPADLPGADPAAAVRLAHPRAAGAGLDPPPDRLDRRLPVLTLRTRARAGGGGGGAGGDRRDPLLRAAVQGGGDERGRAQRATAGGAVVCRPGPVRGAAAGGLRDPVRHPPDRCHRAPPRDGAGDRAGIAGQAAGVRGDRGAGNPAPAGRGRHRHPGRGRRRRIRQRHPAIGLPRPDPARVHRDRVPAAPVPRGGGRVPGPGRPAAGALAVHRLPGAGQRDGAADRAGRAGAARRGRAGRGQLRAGAAAGARPPVAGAGGLHRRPVRGHRHGDRGQRGAVDHGQQRPGAAAAAAARGAFAADGDRTPGAVGAPGGDPAAGIGRIRLPPARAGPAVPRPARPACVRRGGAIRAGPDRRVVLARRQPCRRLCRPVQRGRVVGLVPAAAGAAAGQWTQPRLAARRPAGPGLAAPGVAVRAARLGSADPRRVLVAAGQRGRVRVRVDALPAAAAGPAGRRRIPGSLRAPAGAGARRLGRQGARQRTADPGRTHPRRGACAAGLPGIRRQPGAAVGSRTAGRPRAGAAHRAPAGVRAGRRLRTQHPDLGAARFGHGAGRSGQPAGRNQQRPALQPRGADHHPREHRAGGERGRCADAACRLEPPLPAAVRLPRRHALRRPAGRRPAALERRPRRDGAGRRRGAHRTPAGAPARGHAARVRARARQRPGHRNARTAAARRRLRHQLQRHQRLQARRTGAARGQRDPGAAGRTAHPRGRGRAAEQDPLPRRDQP